MKTAQAAIVITLIVALPISYVVVADLTDSGLSAGQEAASDGLQTDHHLTARAKDGHPGQGRGPKKLPPPFQTSTTSASAETSTTHRDQPTTTTQSPSTSTTAATTTSSSGSGSGGQSGGIITGSACPCTVSGTVELRGDVSLQGDLVVKNGTLLARSGVHIKGNGHQIMVMGGGALDFQGTAKSGWVEWGLSPTGWRSGDRLAIAPLANGDYSVHYGTWSENWSAVSPSTVTLSNGTKVRAEVVNLTRDIVIEDVSRIMIHHGATKQTIKHVAVVDSGRAGELGFYPIHFHLSGTTTAGSVVEGVVVENGQNHAFVPHGVHNITFRDVAAVNTKLEAYWWDKPTTDDSSNNSHNIRYEHAVALGMTTSDTRGGAFQMGAGTNNSCIDCHAAAAQGGKDTAGFLWPEFRGGAVPTEGVWEFRDAVSHNNRNDGIFVWQNVTRPHVIEDTLVYRNGRAGVDHGAYGNTYRYQNIVSFENGEADIKNRAFGRDCDEDRNHVPKFVDISANTLMIFEHHKEGFNCPAEYHRIDVDSVIVDEETGDPGIQRFYDSNLSPDDFVMISPRPESIFEIYEGGKLKHRWTQESWSGN